MGALAPYRKTVVGAVALACNAIAAATTVGGLVPVAALPYVSAFVLLAGSYGIYATPNARRLEVGDDGPAHRA